VAPAASPVAGAPPPRRPRFAASAATTYGTSLAVAVVSLVNVLITARYLGAVGRGEIALIITITTLTSTLALLGVEQATVNIAGREPGSRRALATNSVLLAGALGACAAALVAVLVVVAPAVGGDLSTGLLALALGGIPVLLARTYLAALLQADYRFGIANVTRLLSPTTGVVVNGVLAAASVLTVGSAVATWIGGQLLGVLLLARFVARHGAGFGKPDTGLARTTLGFGVRSHPGRVMNLGNYRLDQWFVGTIAGSRELGTYSVAVAWAEALFFLPAALASVQRPDLVRAGRRDAARRAARVFRLGIVVTAPLAVAMALAAPLLCTTIFGEQFSGSVDDLRVLAFGAFGIVAVKLLGDALIAQRRPLLSTAAVGVGLVCTLTLDLILIPAHGGLGAALASTASYTAAGVAAALVFGRALGAPARELLPRPGDVWAVRGVLGRARRRRAMPATPRTG
jgi:O-antigen/teichoic acid export membrane protein